MHTTRALVLFDFDGTMVDSLDRFMDSFLAACREHGYGGVRTRGDFLKLFDTNMYEGMVAAGIPSAEIDPLLRAMATRIDAAGQTYRLFDGVAEMVEHLAERGHTLGIVTSNLSQIVSEYLAGHHVDAFSMILGAESGRSKVEKLRTTAERHAPLPCLYVGDTAGDMLEALRAGVTPVGVGWGWHPSEHLTKAGARAVARTPAELVAVIESLL